MTETHLIFLSRTKSIQEIPDTTDVLVGFLKIWERDVLQIKCNSYLTMKFFQ